MVRSCKTSSQIRVPLQADNGGVVSSHDVALNQYFTNVTRFPTLTLLCSAKDTTYLFILI